MKHSISIPTTAMRWTLFGRRRVSDARDSYTFYDVDENHTIYVYFTSADKEEDEEDEEDDDRDDTYKPPTQCTTTPAMAAEPAIWISAMRRTWRSRFWLLRTWT